MIILVLTQVSLLYYVKNIFFNLEPYIYIYNLLLFLCGTTQRPKVKVYKENLCTACPFLALSSQIPFKMESLRFFIMWLSYKLTPKSQRRDSL